MANFESVARTNYFAVKDPEAFRAWAKRIGVEVITNEANAAEPLYGLLCDGGIPSSYWDATVGEDEAVDFIEELATHLQDGHVAVVMEVGFEKLRYLVGVATAVNAAGDVRQVSLDDVYDAAQALGEHVTAAEY